LASDYADFLRDMAQPYGQYRQSLSLTSNTDNANKAMQAITQFTQGWETIAAKYATDVPKPFANNVDFAAKITRPIVVGKEALVLMQEGKVARAHLALEEVRYLLWDMRVRAGLNSITDKSNDFHEAMEIIFDQSSSAKNAEELISVGERYGAWLAIKWEDHALADDLALIRKEFDPAFSEGRKAVADYLDALRGGNIDAANKLSRGVKNAYKKMWALDPK